MPNSDSSNLGPCPHQWCGAASGEPCRTGYFVSPGQPLLATKSHDGRQVITTTRPYATEVRP